MRFEMFSYFFGFGFGIIAGLSATILFPMSQEETLILTCIVMGFLAIFVFIEVPRIETRRNSKLKRNGGEK